MPSLQHRTLVRDAKWIMASTSHMFRFDFAKPGLPWGATIDAIP